jgi:HprK-related kinase A
LKILDKSEASFLRDLRGRGVWLRTGPFQTHLQSPIKSLGRAIHLLYGEFPLVENADFADFHIRLLPSRIRRFYRPQVFFYLDNFMPFKPLALGHAFAMFEWCMNWCIESQANHYFMMHAALVEREGFAAILAAPPGSGKSTLTAALVTSGWRLLSDELTLIDPGNGMVVPLARPISLKNESINIIRDFVPNAVMGPVARDTIKGSVAHLKPPADSIARVGERAKPRWVIFPAFKAGAPASLTPYPKATALLRLADHAFNYCQYGVQGFKLMEQLISSCECYEFTYSRFEDALEVFNTLSTHHSLKAAQR